MLIVDGSAGLLDELPAGLPLGLAGIFHVRRYAFPAGARLLLYTDGLVEARNRSGEFLPHARIAEAISTGSLDEALDRLLAAARSHVSRAALGDDLALMLIELVSEAAEPSPQGAAFTPSAPLTLKAPAP